LYDPFASSTSELVGKAFGIPYNDGAWASGYLYTDNFKIGGITATDQQFGGATSLTDKFIDRNFGADGVLGE
jgi:hypothetical protein